MALMYFAHPIDFADHKCVDVIRRVRETAAVLIGVTTYDPQTSWIVTVPHDARVQAVNEQALRMADVVLAYLPDGTWTRGVPAEITLALELRKPVIMLVDYGFGGKSIVELYWSQKSGVTVFSADFAGVATLHAGELAKQQKPTDTCKTAYFETDTDTEQLTRAYKGDAGYDLAYNGTEPMTIRSSERAAVPTGVKVEMPEGYYSIIVGRSSTFSKLNLHVPLSVIDAGFRGELFVVCWNYSDEDTVIMPNQRIGQLLPLKLEADLITFELGALRPSDRGELGFGSSGR
jgi:deoxyuridine 5'-triphosphate nucleotidohydrolase